MEWTPELAACPRVLDVLVGRYIMGLNVYESWPSPDDADADRIGHWLEAGDSYYVDEKGIAWELPAYSGNDVVAVLTVIPRLIETGWEVSIQYGLDHTVRVELQQFDPVCGGARKISASAGSLARSLAYAALRAFNVDLPPDAEEKIARLMGE